MTERIYLDWSAGAPLAACAREAMIAAMDIRGNADSAHGSGRRARAAMDDARREVAAFVDAPSGGEVIFVSSATEANHLALSLAGRFAVSAGAHPSALAPVRRAGGVVVPIKDNGQIEIDALAAILARLGAGALLSVPLANAETGALEDVPALLACVRAYAARLHIDASQAMGKVAFSLRASGVDALTVSSVKLGGPAGVAALAVAEGLDVQAMFVGGGQEGRRRAGSGNLIGCMGFAAAAAQARRQRWTHTEALRDAFEASLCSRWPDTRIFAKQAARLPNVSCFVGPAVSADAVIACDLEGIEIGAGSACSSGKLGGAPEALVAMGASQNEAARALRVSLGHDAVSGDAERCLAALATLRARLDAAQAA